MRRFKVIVTPDAEEDLKRYVIYIRNKLKNPQAVKNVLYDFKETKKSLSSVAESLPDPISEALLSRGLKRINFLKHNYFMLYYIGMDGIVYITNIFHGLENFDQKLK